MGQCKNCIHYKYLYMPAVHKYTYDCELDKKNVSCKGNYDNGKTKAYIKIGVKK